jgi:hypothetical protein
MMKRRGREEPKLTKEKDHERSLLRITCNKRKRTEGKMNIVEEIWA